jgi:hypothetical protein
MLTWDSVRTIDTHVISRYHFTRGSDINLTATDIFFNMYSYAPPLHIIKISRHHRNPPINIIPHHQTYSMVGIAAGKGFMALRNFDQFALLGIRPTTKL